MRSIQMEHACLGCYRELKQEEMPQGYHPTCSRKLFSVSVPPRVDFGWEHLEQMAKKALNRHLGITGVQPKISLNIEKNAKSAQHRLRITGLWGRFILKPSSRRFPEMAVVEDLTMHLASVAGIRTARHGLIWLQSGELAYITQRFDRGKKGAKIAVEDFCQLSGFLTESKYKASTERAGKVIAQYASNSGLDLILFFDLCVFSFLTGNADMHLKNFSLIETEEGEIALSPAYDLLSTKLMPIRDTEEMALTVNGKKARLKRADFLKMGASLKIPTKAMEHSFQRMGEAIPKMLEWIDVSFLSEDLKKRYLQLIAQRAERLEIG